MFANLWVRSSSLMRFDKSLPNKNSVFSEFEHKSLYSSLITLLMNCFLLSDISYDACPNMVAISAVVWATN